MAIRRNWDATGQQDESTSVPSSLPRDCPSLCLKTCEMVTAAGMRDGGRKLGAMREKIQSVGKRHNPGTNAPARKDRPNMWELLAVLMVPLQLVLLIDVANLKLKPQNSLCTMQGL